MVGRKKVIGMEEIRSARGRYTLYGTSACHLCELAQEMLQQLAQVAPGFVYSAVDISDSEKLFQRYGLRIPVLTDQRGRELDWPFTPDQLWAFYRS